MVLISRKEYSKKYYQDHKEKILSRSKKYRKEHIEEIKDYLEKNKERITKRNKKYNKEWGILNREHLNEYSIDWRKKNLEKSKVIKQRHSDKLKEERRKNKKIKEDNKYF